MRWSALFLLVLLFINQIFAQDAAVRPTEAQGQQVVGGTALKTCVNYGDVPPDDGISPDCPPEPCSECQNNGGSSSTSDTNTVTAYDSQGVMASFSKIDAKFNHIHIAKEYNSLTSLPSCSSCGSDGFKPQDHLPSLYLNRYHRFRDITEQSSFGPGVFSNFDMSLSLSVEGTGNRIRFFDSQYYYVIVYQDGLYSDTKDGVFYENLRPYDQARVTNKAELLNASNVLTTDLTLAKTVVITNQRGRKFIFEVISLGNGSLGGRLTQIKDRNGYVVTISYKTWTQAEIDASPSRQYQINTVSDPFNRVMTFQYAATQVSGQWVVSSITLPNTQTIQYNYNSGFLTQVTHGDGSHSNFTYTTEAVSQCTVVSYDDASAEGTHRRKKVYLTNHFSEQTWNGLASVYNSSSLLVRMVVNGAGEVSYFNLFNPSFPYEWINYIEGKVQYVYDGRQYKYFQDGWSFNAAGGWNAITGTKESSFWEDGWGSIQNHFKNTPNWTRDDKGVVINFQYNNRNFVTQKSYADGSTEQYAYNDFMQITRYKDRDNRVTKNTYDAQGNLLKTEVGILAVGNTDVNQPEYAFYTKAYFPAGHPHQFLLASSTDANGNTTDFEYNSNHFLVKIIEPADEIGGQRFEKSINIDTYGRVTAQTDEMGRTTSFFYDNRDRVAKVLYPDISTEKYFYGTDADFNQNLVTRKVDRNGNVTDLTFDLHGRLTKTTQGAFTMNDSNVAVAVADATTKVEYSNVYKYGTNHTVIQSTNAGEKTDYFYDYKNRQLKMTQYPNQVTNLITQYSYTNNLLVQSTDPFNRKTFTVYRASDANPIRQVIETIPNAVANALTAASITRNMTPNAPYIVHDDILNNSGQTLQHIDPRGIYNVKVYDSRSRLTQAIKASSTPDEAKTVYVYDANSNIITIQHPRNFDTTDTQFGKCITAMTYTGRNLLKTRTEGVGSAVEASEVFAYTKDKREQTHGDFKGNIWTTIWHICCGRLEAKVDPLGNGTVTDVDYAGNVVHQYSGSGLPLDSTQYVCNNQPITTLNETTTRFDERNRPTHTTQWLQVLGSITNKGRPALGNGQIPIAGEDGVPSSQGLTTRFVYDDNLIDSIGLDAIYAANIAGLNLGANANGSAVEVTNPDGEKTLVIKDGLGRTIKTVDALGHETVTVYDTVVGGLVETKNIISPSSLALTNKTQQDKLGRIQKVIDAENFISNFEFDNNGNRIKSRDANNVGLDCIYNYRNLDTQCTDTLGAVTSKIYNKQNQLISQTDALGKITTLTFDARNRQVTMNNRINALVTNVFDANNNLVSVTDGEGNKTQYVYNERNLQTERIFADSSDATDKIIFTYDALRRKSSQTDQAGVTISYSFDMANRLLQRNYPDNLNDVFQYDPASRLTQAVSNRYANTVTRSYNDDSTLASEGLITNSQNYQITHQYDSAHRETSITYPNGKVIYKVYTNRSQLSSIAYDNSIVANFTYDAGKRETARGLGNGLTQISNYNLDNTIQQKTVAGVTNFSYTYDANKRKLTETDAVNTNLSQTFAYDFENRLTSWSSNGTTLNQTQSWALSLEGAWNTNTINGNTETRTFNAAYETLNSNKNSINSPLTHDRKGNLTQNKDGSLYTWDFDSQLSFSVSGTPSVNASYAYDALGRRVSKTASNTTTIYVSTGYQIATEYKSVNNSAFSESQSYVYATYVDEPLVLINANGRFYYHNNQQFSVSKLTDSNQNIIESYAYNAYGDLKILADSSAVDNIYFFTGRQLDSETGLFYFRARYYDAKLGQFISRDPIGYVDGFSLYRGYFAINNLDPTGLIDPAEGPLLAMAEAIVDVINFFGGPTDILINVTRTFHIDAAPIRETLTDTKYGPTQTESRTDKSYYWDSSTCTCWETTNIWTRTFRTVETISMETMTFNYFDMIVHFQGYVSNSVANQVFNNIGNISTFVPGTGAQVAGIIATIGDMATSGLSLSDIRMSYSIANEDHHTYVLSSNYNSTTQTLLTGHSATPPVKTNKLRSECVGSGSSSN